MTKISHPNNADAGSPVGSAAGLEAEPVMYCEPAFWCRYTSGISTLSV